MLDVEPGPKHVLYLKSQIWDGTWSQVWDGAWSKVQYWTKYEMGPGSKYVVGLEWGIAKI